MTALTIHLNSESDIFSVVQTENNSASSRTFHPIEEFEELLGIRLQAPSISTGLMPSSLILTDESAATKTLIFYYPEIKYSLNINTSYNHSVVANNPDLFSIETQGEEDDDGDDNSYDYLQVKDIIAKNVCFVIRQDKNTTATDYTVGVLTNMIGTRITPTTELVCPWGNCFGQSICWHNEFDKSRLTNPDPFALETIPYAYLNSLFNQDLTVSGELQYDPEYVNSPYYLVASSDIARHAIYMHWCATVKGISPFDGIDGRDTRSFQKCYSFNDLKKGIFSSLRND